MSQDPNDGGLSRKHIMSSIDSSLRRLKTDYVDIYRIQRWDYDTPIIGATILEHLEDAVAALSVKLTQTEINQLEELYQPHPVLDHA